jgi:hypothetical protein
LDVYRIGHILAEGGIMKHEHHVVLYTGSTRPLPLRFARLCMAPSRVDTSHCNIVTYPKERI